jgi:HlyD family type I secretion membrane fusion protein
MKPQQTPDIITLTAADDRPEVRIEALLEDGGQTRGLRITLAAIVLLVIAFLVWSVFAQVDELARARGELQPSGHIQVLQTEEGGSIVTLYVREGDTVSAGQPVVNFAATTLEKEKAQTEIKIGALSIERERLLALLDGRDPDFSGFDDFPLLVEQARIGYRTQLASRNAMLSAKRSEGTEQSSLRAGALQEETILERQIAEARERLRLLEEGVKKGVVRKLDLTEARQQVSSLEQQRAELLARAEGISSTIGGVDAEVQRLVAEFDRELSQTLSETTEQLRELQAELDALNAREERSDLKSPIDGIVIDLPQTAEGAVIPPGGMVAEIVPTDGDVVMEAMVTPRDIGFVKVGQRASVKIDSFDAARFGAIEGQVKRVAPNSTKRKEDGMPFYKVEVSLAQNYVGSPEHRLIPGMTGEADIATGRKSVMQFLLKPVFSAADTAFHER